VSDLYGWILDQVAAREDVARAATAGPWEAESHYVRGTREVVYSEVHPVAELEGNGDGGVLSEADARHIALNGPADVLRRCAADRKLLTLHKPRGVDWTADDREWAGNPHVCEGCGQEGICQDWVTEHANDCPVLLAVAEGYGLTETERAVLDRPRWEPARSSGSSPLGEAAARAWETALRATLRATSVHQSAFVLSDEVEPSPKEKALRILGPELRTIPLYRPPEDPTP
jgi:hypothetical protein